MKYMRVYRRGLTSVCGLLFVGIVLCSCMEGEKAGRVIDRNGSPISGAFLTLEYAYSYKFRFPMEESEGTGTGTAWRTVVKTDVERYYPIPSVPTRADAGWRYRMSVLPKLYVPPVISKTMNLSKTLVIPVENEGLSIGSVARYGEVPQPLVVEYKVFDLTNEEQIKERIAQLNDVYYSAPNPDIHSHHNSYRWEDRKILVDSMYKEVKYICSCWKPEYHPKTWLAKRTDLPLVC